MTPEKLETSEMTCKITLKRGVVVIPPSHEISAYCWPHNSCSWRWGFRLFSSPNRLDFPSFHTSMWSPIVEIYSVKMLRTSNEKNEAWQNHDGSQPGGRRDRWEVGRVQGAHKGKGKTICIWSTFSAAVLNWLLKRMTVVLTTDLTFLFIMTISNGNWFLSSDMF